MWLPSEVDNERLARMNVDTNSMLIKKIISLGQSALQPKRQTGKTRVSHRSSRDHSPRKKKEESSFQQATQVERRKKIDEMNPEMTEPKQENEKRQGK